MFPLKPKNSTSSKGRVKNNESHTAATKFGSGDFYGTGIRNPMGRIRMNSMIAAPKKPKKSNPPKSLA